LHRIAIFLRFYPILELNVISFAGSKEITKENSFSRCTKFAKNQRHSLNFGNSSLRSSDSPKFLTLIPRFFIRKFPEAGRSSDRSRLITIKPFKLQYFSIFTSLYIHSKDNVPSFILRSSLVSTISKAYPRFNHQILLI